MYQGFVNTFDGKESSYLSSPVLEEPILGETYLYEELQNVVFEESYQRSEINLVGTLWVYSTKPRWINDNQPELCLVKIEGTKDFVPKIGTFNEVYSIPEDSTLYRQMENVTHSEYVKWMAEISALPLNRRANRMEELNANYLG